MNDLSTLGSLGLELPSIGYIFGSILFGIIGVLAYRRGRKQSSPTLIWSGVALMLYPYAVSQTWLLWVVGIALCGWVYMRWE